MASVEAMQCNGKLRSGVEYWNGGSVKVDAVDVKENTSLGDTHIEDVDLFVDDITDNFDSILEDINDRLTISRMVSHSITKGVVSAVSQEAVEVVAVKEQEVARLKETLYGQRFVDWESDLVIRKELEGMIFCTTIQSLHEEHEKGQWDVNNVLAFIDRCKEISSLRHELDSIQKILISPEVGHHSPQGSLDADIFHRRRILGDGDGTHEDSKMNMPEHFETSKLSHMSRQELYQFFRSEITQMKRDHESDVHQMTDEYFRLKRELLREKELHKERGPLASFRKDKDFDFFKKKMSETISRLDDILKENTKLSEFCDHSRETLSSLLSENSRLLDVLNNMKLEAGYLSWQASDVSEKLSQRSLAEEKLRNLVVDLTSALEDAKLKASISEDFYKCILREVSSEVQSDDEDVYFKSVMVEDITRTIYQEAFRAADAVIQSDYADISDLEFAVTEQIYGVVMKEVLTGMAMELSHMKKRCLKGNESLFHLETRVSEVMAELNSEFEANDRLKQQVSDLEQLLIDKDRSLYDVTEELGRIMDLTNEQEGLIADRDEELGLLERKLEESQHHADLYMMEVSKLIEALRKSDEEKTMFASALEQQQKYLALLNANDREHKKQMESLCHVIEGFLKSITDFEHRTNESISWHRSRLENSAFQLRSLVPKANMLRRTSLLYKERLEKRSTDLQKAEAEVDLLGDEVDTLLRLLEKIYVALDHYAPVLQHYPGIIEILKLVRRELSGEAVKRL